MLVKLARCLKFCTWPETLQVLTSVSNLWTVVSGTRVFSNKRGPGRSYFVALFWTSNQISPRLCPGHCQRTVLFKSAPKKHCGQECTKSGSCISTVPPTLLQQTLHLQTAHMSSCNVSRAFSIHTRTENRWQKKGKELWWWKTNPSHFKREFYHS